MIDRYKLAFRSARRPALIIGYALLATAMLALIYYLRVADKPWENGVGARVAAGRNVKVIHHIISGMWYASWINLILCGLLAIAMPFIARPLASFERKKAGISPRSRAAFLIASLAAVGLALFVSLPRLDSSLWGDEEYTLRRSVIGEYERDAEDVPQLRALSWPETFWTYRKPNNHILNSVLTRISHATFFHQGAGPQQFHFSEPILRLPAFLAALGAVAATGYALACLGFLRAGIVAMFLLVLHPWFIRYGTETRGYAFVLLFCALSIVFLIKAIRRGRWRYWIAYGLCEFLMFLAYPGTFYLLVSMNLSALALALTARGGWANRRIQLGRLIVANVVAGMLVIQTMAPCYAQLKAYFAKSEGQHLDSWAWVFDNLSYLASGMPWRMWELGNPLCHTLEQRPLLGGLLLALAAAAFVAGTIRFYRASLQSRYLLALFLLQWPLLLGLSMLQGTGLYHWYSLAVLVPATMLIAVGIEWLSRAPFWGGARKLSWIGAPIYLGLFAVVAGPQISALRGHSIEPLRESVVATRAIVNPAHPDVDEVMTVGFHQATRAYDASMYFIRKSDPPEKFENLLAKASRENKPLFVNLAMLDGARGEFPGIMRIVDDPTQFALTGELRGMASNTTRYIFKYIGGGD